MYKRQERQRQRHREREILIIGLKFPVTAVSAVRAGMITRNHRRVIVTTNMYMIFHYSGRQIRQTTTEQTAEFWWTSLSRTAGTLSRSPRLACHIVLRPYSTTSVVTLSWRNMTRNTDWTCRGQDYDQEHRLEIVQEYDQEERLDMQGSGT